MYLLLEVQDVMSVFVEERLRWLESKLVVSLHATPRYPAIFWKQAELIGRWGITRNGVVSERP